VAEPRVSAQLSEATVGLENGVSWTWPSSCSSKGSDLPSPWFSIRTTTRCPELMTGSLADAEDAVQERWVRSARSDAMRVVPAAGVKRACRWQ